MKGLRRDYGQGQWSDWSGMYLYVSTSYIQFWQIRVTVLRVQTDVSTLCKFHVNLIKYFVKFQERKITFWKSINVNISTLLHATTASR